MLNEDELFGFYPTNKKITYLKWVGATLVLISSTIIWLTENQTFWFLVTQLIYVTFFFREIKSEIFKNMYIKEQINQNGFKKTAIKIYIITRRLMKRGIEDFKEDKIIRDNTSYIPFVFASMSSMTGIFLIVFCSIRFLVVSTAGFFLKIEEITEDLINYIVESFFAFIEENEEATSGQENEGFKDNELEMALSTLELDSLPDLMTLKKRYRKLVKIYHPDIQGIKTTNQKLIAANEMIKKINNAVEIVRKYIVKTEGTKDNLN